MALGCSFGVMAIPLAKPLITLGASLQSGCHLQETGVPSAWRFTNTQPMSSGATTSAGRAKKDCRRDWESVVAMGVAFDSSPLILQAA